MSVKRTKVVKKAVAGQSVGALNTDDDDDNITDLDVLTKSPDDKTQPATTDRAMGASAAGTSPTGTVDDSDDGAYDKERALRTIRKLREFEKQAKRLQQELDEAKAQGQTEPSDLQAQLDSLVLERNEFEMKSVVLSRAAELGFQHSEDAWSLLNLADLELKDDGTVEGLNEALQKLAKQKPYLLFRKPSFPTTNPATSGQGRTDDDRYAEDFGKSRGAGGFWTGGGLVGHGE